MFAFDFKTLRDQKDQRRDEQHREKEQQHPRDRPTAHGLAQFLDDDGIRLPFAPVGEMALEGRDVHCTPPLVTFIKMSSRFALVWRNSMILNFFAINSAENLAGGGLVARQFKMNFVGHVARVR